MFFLPIDKPGVKENEKKNKIKKSGLYERASHAKISTREIKGEQVRLGHLAVNCPS